MNMDPIFPFHPVTEIFPPMEATAFAALVEDIAQHGQKEPILVLDGQVIDGRHRVRACEQLGIEPWVRELEAKDGNPLSLVISLNLHRRHLTESQRATIAARLANMPFGGNQHTKLGSANLQTQPVTQTAAAELLNVSPRSLATAKKVLEEGAPELVAAVERGELAVSTAADLSQLPADEQREVLTRTPEDIRAIARDVRQRIQDAEVAGSSAVRIFDQMAKAQGLSAVEQLAVVDAITADAPTLPTPSEARRIAAKGAPGLLVLANDNQYHGAPVSAENALKRERWFKLRDGLEALGTLDFDVEAAIAAIPPYQHANVRLWLGRAVPFLNTFHQNWSQHHA